MLGGYYQIAQCAALKGAPIGFMKHANLRHIWWPHPGRVALQDSGGTDYITEVTDPDGSANVSLTGPATVNLGATYNAVDADFNGQPSIVNGVGDPDHCLQANAAASSFNDFHDYPNKDSHWFFVVNSPSWSSNRVLYQTTTGANGIYVRARTTVGIRTFIQHDATTGANIYDTVAAPSADTTYVVRMSIIGGDAETQVYGLGTTTPLTLASVLASIGDADVPFQIGSTTDTAFKTALVAAYVGALTGGEIDDRLAGLASLFGAVEP